MTETKGTIKRTLPKLVRWTPGEMRDLRRKAKARKMKVEPYIRYVVSNDDPAISSLIF